MEMPRFYGPSLPGGSGPRNSRATPALPYLRGSGRRRRRLRGASLQPPGGRQRRDQEKPEGEQRHPDALHLGQARSSGRQYREGPIGPRDGPREGGSWGRGLEGGAGLGGLRERRTAHARRRTGSRSKKVRFRRQTGARGWRAFPRLNESKLFRCHYSKISNILYIHITIFMCICI